MSLCVHVSVCVCVYACVCIRRRGRERFYIYKCVRQRHKSCAGLLRRGEPHQKCHSSAICYWLKLCNCNSVASVHTTRSMLNKFTRTHIYTEQLHTCKHTRTNADSTRTTEKEYLAQVFSVLPGNCAFMNLFWWQVRVFSVSRYYYFFVGGT